MRSKTEQQVKDKFGNSFEREREKEKQVRKKTSWKVI
jgi:hypothetical protein